MINAATVQYPFLHRDLQMRATYTGTNRIYEGFARAGVAEDATGWQIVMYAYDGSNNLLSAKFADGTNDYDKVWADRATYSY